MSKSKSAFTKVISSNKGPVWQFKNGLDQSLIETRYLPSELIEKWQNALKAALYAKATPLQSNFDVNAGAATKSGELVCGGNHEFSLTKTISHAEEAVIVSALEQYGIDDKLQVIAFARENPGKYTSPCGNCRDAIKTYTDINDLFLIEGRRDGGIASVVLGTSFYRDFFFEINGKEKNDLLTSKGLIEALIAEEQAFDIYSGLSTPKTYGVAIVCENGENFRGSLRGDCAYHPSLPISSAISNFRDGSNRKDRHKIKHILIASTKNMPYVMYKDRQEALEFAEAIQLFNGKTQGQLTLPVYLVNYGNGSQETKVYKTDTHEWLPLAFSPSNLGLENMLAQSYAKLFR